MSHLRLVESPSRRFLPNDTRLLVVSQLRCTITCYVTSCLVYDRLLHRNLSCTASYITAYYIIIYCTTTWCWEGYVGAELGCLNSMNKLWHSHYGVVPSHYSMFLLPKRVTIMLLKNVNTMRGLEEDIRPCDTICYEDVRR